MGKLGGKSKGTSKAKQQDRDLWGFPVSRLVNYACDRIIPAGSMELVRASFSIRSGLPCEKVGSASGANQFPVGSRIR